MAFAEVISQYEVRVDYSWPYTLGLVSFKEDHVKAGFEDIYTMMEAEIGVKSLQAEECQR